MLIPGEVRNGDIVIYNGDDRVQVHLTDQRLLIRGQEYVFRHWHPSLLTGIILLGFDNAFPARVFTKKEPDHKVPAFVPGVLGRGDQ